ncbi:MAG: BatA domain-containing protein [Flavobacteriales bacterium]
MTFLNPTYLWALMGILVPIVIHLWNRKKVLTIKVGSIKMLKESEPKRTSSIRPNEWWLLLLRILIVTLMVFILAEPILKSKENKELLTYIIEPELLHLKSMQQLLDSVPSNAQRVLVKGFPKVDEYNLPTAKSHVPKYWQMAQEMENLATDSIILFTRGLVSGIHGMRPKTHQRLNWIVMDTGKDTTALVEATVNKDSIELRSIASDSKSLAFKSTTISKINKEIKVNDSKDSIRVNGNWIPLTVDNPLKVLIVADDSLNTEINYIKSAYRAIGKFLDSPIEINSVKKIDTLDMEAYATLIWFSKEKLKNPPINTVLYKPDSLANQLVVQGDSKNTFFLTGPLNSENITTEHLPEKLLELLSLHEDLTEKVSNYDLRTIDSKELQTFSFNVKKDKKYSKNYKITFWIWLLLVIFMVFERILAKYRRQ